MAVMPMLLSLELSFQDQAPVLSKVKGQIRTGWPSEGECDSEEDKL